MKNMTDDVIGIIDALGYDTAITIGHDWGGPIALNTAALNEDRISATGTMSVPFTGRGPMPPLKLWKEIYQDNFFYQLYFFHISKHLGNQNQYISTHVYK